MTAFGEHKIVPVEEAGITYGPDALTLCHRIAERHDLVAGNYADAVPEIDYFIDNTAPNEVSADLLRSALRSRRDALQQRNANLQQALKDQPLAVAYAGLRTFSFLLHVHTLHAPEIFKGYTPVDTNPDWPKTLHSDGFVKYGYYEEPFIGFAIEMDALEDTRFGTYSQLFVEAMNRRMLTYDPPAMRRQPLLN